LLLVTLTTPTPGDHLANQVF